MTVRASGPIPTASAARTEADAALSGWQNGAVTAASALAALRRVAVTAADHANLGVLLRATGDTEAARAAYNRVIAIDPGFVPARYNLGNLLLDVGQPEAAAASYEAALRPDPIHAQAWNGLGLARQRLAQFPAAEQAFATAISHASDWAEAHLNHGVALFALERHEEARAAYRACLARDPRNAAAHGNLGALLLRGGYPIAAEQSCRQALALAPNEHRWHANLAVALQQQARHTEAEAAYRAALALRPDYAGGHGTFLFALNYRADLTDAAIIDEYRRWDTTHARPLRHHHAFPPRDPARRLRIGYLSPDFRQHAVALFTEPLLIAHDRAKVELFLYAELAVEDAVTARFRALADHWRPTIGQSDDAVAAMIRADGIDVLIDLGGHTANARPLVLARKPAPIQLTYPLGHGTTSGLSAMDGILTDAHIAPPGTDTLFTEKLIRLPRAPFVYQPPDAMPPPETARPAGPPIFGHFGRAERLTEPVIAAWSAILRAIPDARLILDNRPFQEPAFRALFLDRFAHHGIPADRLDPRYTTPQDALWRAYRDIDIALDPFPHNAGTTTIEALWMGVPVLTLASRPGVGRLGASILAALGLHDWITADPDAYVARAIAATRDIDSLRHDRAALRARFSASSLRDAPGLARAIEAVCFRLRDQPASHDRLRHLFQTDDPATRAQADALLAADPDDGFAAHVAALLAHRQGAWAEADRLLRVTLAQSPDDPEANANHAAILRKLGRLTDAETAARAALRLAPDRTETHNNLGNILRDAGQFEAAITSFETAVHARPDFADAWANLAWVRALCGQAEEAERAARQAIAADATNPNGHNNLGLALMRQSRLREAEDALRQALTLKPDFALAHSNILFCLNYREDLSAEAIFAEYQDWDRRHARALAPASPDWLVDPTPGRRLRVGYVSPDFRHHAVALFAEPLLAAHDGSRVELFCYAELAVGDATTERFKAMADHWRPTIGMDDDAVAAMIRADRIDVLVDLAGHTAGNRLLVFARRPAPVQVAFMLGHGYTSGLSAIDAFLADAHLVPPGAEALFSETVVRLPRIPLAYLPPAAMPEVAAPPCLRNGFLTFGYFGRTVRLNDQVLTVWADLLRAIPSAKLMLNNGPFAEPAGRTRMLARFAALGIDADRLILTCTAPQPATWAAYGEIDIALDPFPHNAGTTTIEALWMGVPVLTLADRPSVGRFGASILAALGLEDWVATDPAAYVARAVRAADDPAGLATLHADLRPRFRASPLHDAPGLARAIEDAYRGLWDGCRGKTRARGPDHTSSPNTSSPGLSGGPSLAPAEAEHGPRDKSGDDKAVSAASIPPERADPRALFLRGDIEAALAAAACQPDEPDSLHIQALVTFQRGDALAGAAILARAPDRADLLTGRGVMLRAARRPAEAEAAYRAALALDPGFAPALGNLGNLLLDSGKTDAAETLFTRALTQTPDQPWLLRGKALALIAREAAGDAETLLRRALAIAPLDPEAHETLGALLGQTGRPIEAEKHHREGLRGLRERPRGLGNLAIALQAQGRHQEADACYREALRLRPDYASMHGNALFGLNYRDDLAPEAIYAEYRAWDAAHAAKMPPIGRRGGLPTMTIERTTDEATVRSPRTRPDRLRIAYISPDFRRHAVAHFALPWIAAHDRTAVDVVLYAEVARPDPMTARFRDAATLWRDTAGLTDEAVAAMIRDDGIDVIVDLAGHTGGNRLLALARRPAPVQIEALLGLGTTTGMEAMDAFLADDRLAPPCADAWFSERIIRLPRIPLVYAPPAGMPEPNPPPCVAHGTITFGYFGRVQRLTPRTIAAWARILRGVPGARLLLNSHPFVEPAFRALIAERFAAHGVGVDRLRMCFTTPQAATWAAYAEVDIALDPFPHNAGTTTIEALWMGVPVVTRADRPAVGRFGAAILGSLGLDDWVTDDDDAYVTRAITAAGDHRALAALRATLRERFDRSALRDARGLAAATEDTYRALLEAAFSRARAA